MNVNKPLFIWCAVAALTITDPAAAGPPIKTVPAAKDPAKAVSTKPPASTNIGASSTPVATPPVRFEQLSSKAQFNALGDDTLLDIGGRKIRKADFIADFKRRTASGQIGEANRPDGLPAIQARRAAEEEAAIAMSAAEVRRSLAESKARGGAP